MGREIRQRNLAVLTAVANGVGGVVFTVGGTYLLTHVRTALGLLAVGLVCAVLPPLVTSFGKIRAEVASAHESALTSLAELTHLLCEIEEPCDLRVTLMVVNRAYETPRLQQMIRHGCSGHQGPGKSWMTTQQGVAGLSLRKMEGKVESLIVKIDPGDFQNQMVLLGFTKDEAKGFKERGSYLCPPVVNSAGEGIAVLCLDSKERDVFKPEHTRAVERLTPFFARFLANTERSMGENA